MHIANFNTSQHYKTFFTSDTSPCKNEVRVEVSYYHMY